MTILLVHRQNLLTLMELFAAQWSGPIPSSSRIQPYMEIGRIKRCFNHKWFNMYKWMGHSELTHAAYC